MFWKWEKSSSKLFFHVGVMKLSKPMDSFFQLEWIRGESKGSTTKILGNADGTAVDFNSDFTCPCTMYIAKGDKGIRPKNVKFTIKRYISATEAKIFGKLTVDVSKYFKATQPTEASFEMESGRSNPPVIQMNFLFTEKGVASSTEAVDDIDKSFIGDSGDTHKPGLDEWDVTEMVEKKPDAAWKPPIEMMDQIPATIDTQPQTSLPSEVANSFLSYLQQDDKPQRALPSLKSFEKKIEAKPKTPDTDDTAPMPDTAAEKADEDSKEHHHHHHHHDKDKEKDKGNDDEKDKEHHHHHHHHDKDHPKKEKTDEKVTVQAEEPDKAGEAVKSEVPKSADQPLASAPQPASESPKTSAVVVEETKPKEAETKVEEKEKTEATSQKPQTISAPQNTNDDITATLNNTITSSEVVEAAVSISTPSGQSTNIDVKQNQEKGPIEANISKENVIEAPTHIEANAEKTKITEDTTVAPTINEPENKSAEIKQELEIISSPSAEEKTEEIEGKKIEAPETHKIEINASEEKSTILEKIEVPLSTTTIETKTEDQLKSSPNEDIVSKPQKAKKEEHSKKHPNEENKSQEQPKENSGEVKKSNSISKMAEVDTSPKTQDETENISPSINLKPIVNEQINATVKKEESATTSTEAVTKAEEHKLTENSGVKIKVSDKAIVAQQLPEPSNNAPSSEIKSPTKNESSEKTAKEMNSTDNKRTSEVISTQPIEKQSPHKDEIHKSGTLTPQLGESANQNTSVKILPTEEIKVEPPTPVQTAQPSTPKAEHQISKSESIQLKVSEPKNDNKILQPSHPESPRPNKEPVNAKVEISTPIIEIQKKETSSQKGEPSKLKVESPKQKASEETDISTHIKIETSPNKIESKESQIESPKIKPESPKLEVESPKPKIESTKSDVESPKPKTESPKLKAESPKPTMESPKLKAESPKLKAESPKPTTESPKLKAESPKPTTESPKLKAESPKPTTESPKLKAESPKPTTESLKPKDESPIQQFQISKPKITPIEGKTEKQSENLEQAASESSESSDSEAPSEDPTDLLSSILRQSWPEPQTPSYADSAKKVRIPPAVFPFFSAIIRSKALCSKSTSILERFFSLYAAAPITDRCPNQIKFFTSFLLSKLCAFFAHQMGFHPTLVSLFQSFMEPFINQLYDGTLFSVYQNVETVCNRLSTAKFTSKDLIDDFKQIIESPSQMLILPPLMVDYTVKHLISYIDARAANKMISNSSHFCFSNGALWNTFLTELESTISVHFPLLRQIVSAIMMAYNISLDPTLRKDLCPDIPPSCVLIILKKSHFDDMMPFVVDPSLFSEAVGVEVGTPPVEIPPQKVGKITDKDFEIVYENWNKCKLSEEMEQKFPFLSELYSKQG